MRMRRTFLFTILCLATPFVFAAESDVQVLLVRPNAKDVADVQQISVTFSKPMVPLGDFEKSAKDFKIDVTPKVDCGWRWLNTTTISCQLPRALPASNAYDISIPSGLRALDGTTLKAGVTATFTTSRWEVVNKEIEWHGADVPTVYLSFNQPMDLASLQANSRSECGRVAVSPVKKDVAMDMGLDPARTYAFAYASPIGIGKSCELRIGENAKSALGPIPSAPFSYPFVTYPEFKIESVRCAENITGKAINAKTIQLKNATPTDRCTSTSPRRRPGRGFRGKSKPFRPSVGPRAGRFSRVLPAICRRRISTRHPSRTDERRG